MRAREQWASFHITSSDTFGAALDFEATIERPNGDLLHVAEHTEELSAGKTGTWIYLGKREGNA